MRKYVFYQQGLMHHLSEHVSYPFCSFFWPKWSTKRLYSLPFSLLKMWLFAVRRIIIPSKENVLAAVQLQ
jgi:hypothetical protein